MIPEKTHNQQSKWIAYRKNIVVGFFSKCDEHDNVLQHKMVKKLKSTKIDKNMNQFHYKTELQFTAPSIIILLTRN